MIFLSYRFYIAVIAVLLLYYLVPLKMRWVILLVGSLGIYYCFSGRGILFLAASVLVSYCTGRLMQIMQERQHAKIYKKICLAAGVTAVAAPLLLIKRGNSPLISWQILGISYFTLQMIGYMVDVYRRDIEPERNPAKYTLFISFFPQIVQGPIARFGALQPQFFSENRFEPHKFSKGLQWILWGFFLKMMIANRAGVVVNTVFDNWEIYTGGYVLTAGILYSIQLYTDFMACVFIARGLALLFGIELMDNFSHPYFSDNMKEFWERWHISLSGWLRDYIYIPLGGNRKGKVRKYMHLGIVFVCSGVWHGSGYKYIAWGLLHALYQIMGEITAKGRKGLYALVRMKETEPAAAILKKTLTFFWVMLAWILFRADSFRIGVKMLLSLFTVRNPWIFFDDSLFALGLDSKEFVILLLAVLLLLGVSFWQSRMERGIGEWLLEQHIFLRWGIYILGVSAIVVFGMYGYGFDAQDFIYGGF